MEVVIPGLYASAPEPLSFAPRTTIRAFLLKRPNGNFLIYSVGTLVADAGAVRELGGISWHFLNHWHEAGMGCGPIAETFGAPVVCHRLERQQVSNACSVAETFSERHTFDDDFEAIPIPGHTEGATAYLWNSGQQRCLFTGDTLYFGEDGWRAAVLQSSDREAYIASLDLIGQLDFDVIVPWAAPIGRPFHTHTDKADARRRIDAIIERVRRGGDH